MTIPSSPASSQTLGLTAAAAHAALLADGFNELQSAKPRKNWLIAWRVICEPMLLLLVACGAVYLMLGDLHGALVLLCFLLMVVSLTFYQEHKTERALEALRNLASPRALVLRDGVATRIAGREVVRGDLLILAEGDRVPADAILLSCLNMAVDESLLTGESLPVNKALLTPPPEQMGQAGGDALPFLFSGSLIVQGKGSARVMATGMQTAIGKIGKALFALEEEPTKVQAETARVVKWVASASFACALFLALWFGATRGDWLNGLLVGITFAMALIPEELPVILTLFLGLGAWRLSQKRVLTRHIPAIESLGAATVLCVDKTGTLTENKMAVAQLFAAGDYFDCRAAPQSGAAPSSTSTSSFPESFHEVLEFAILASQREPSDPMEIAIQAAGQRLLTGTEHLHTQWNLIEEYQLSKELLAMSRVWHGADDQTYVVAAKGAPEAIADLCHLSAADISTLMQQVNHMAGQGLRVLGVARANTTSQPLPEIQHDFDFQLLGLIGLADPVRADVPAALAECRSAGIRVVMITGDYPATALCIAEQCGLDSAAGAITGSELAALDEAQLQTRIQHVNIFCRVAPEQKLQLVTALKASGETVVMTGDGVNDAPALKAAHIGIAMGKRGSDVARESASLILLDDDFNAIVAAVKLGRRIFDNLRKTVAFIVAVHIPIIGMSMLPVLFGWPVVLMPIHILVLQLIIDPSCSLVFEAEPAEADVMQRPPRAAKSSIYQRPILINGALQGFILLLTVLLTFALALHDDNSPEQARALAFMVMVLGNIGLIFVNRARSAGLFASLHAPNPALWWVSAGGLCLLTIALFSSRLSTLFSFALPHTDDLLIGFAGALLCITLLNLTRSKQLGA
jgi:Ca2+-transporting ATPase